MRSFFYFLNYRILKNSLGNHIIQITFEKTVGFNCQSFSRSINSSLGTYVEKPNLNPQGRLELIFLAIGWM